MQEPVIFPDFFIAGAPRCGTTALSRFIAANPKICFSIRKEPHYFSRLAPDVPIAPDVLERDYLKRYFPHYDPELHVASGEGSVSYLYSPSAIDHILRLNPEARFIVSLRDPMAMIPSYHQRMTYILEEDVKDLEAAWDLGPARSRGESVPRHAADPNLLRYQEVGLHAHWLRNLFERAGRGRCHVLLFDDWVADTRRTYLEVLDFLGVPDDGRTKFFAKQSSRIYKSRLLHRIVFRPPGAEKLVDVVESKRTAPPTLGRMGRPKKKGLKRWRKKLVDYNSIEQPPAPLSTSMHTKFRDAFAKDIHDLEMLLDRDLSHWG